MGEIQQFRWFLGIDVSKETFDACCLNSKGERVFSLSTSMNREGFEELLKQLSSLSIPQEALLAGMESTACYHLNLYSFLISLGYPVIVLNPLLISKYVKLQLRKTKPDIKDASVIALFSSAEPGFSLSNHDLFGYFRSKRSLQAEGELGGPDELDQE